MGRSTARTVSEHLSDLITEGRYAPGSRVSEEALVAQLGVSRNTVREAFRLLAHDGLLVHKFNRGVFVPRVSAEDVRDVYRLRRIVEPQVVRGLTPPDRHRLGRVREAVGQAREAAAAGDWTQAGTGNMHFHRRLVALAGSPRLDATMQRLMAELRLLFAVVADPRSLYEPFVERNKALLELLETGRFEDGAAYLEDYLTDSEGRILAAFEALDRAG